MKPAKTKQHFQNVHPQHKEKKKEFCERHGNALVKMKLISTEDVEERDQKVAVASYVVALQIAKQRKPHTIGENLIKSCSHKMVEIVFGNEIKKAIALIPLSISAVRARISDKPQTSMIKLRNRSGHQHLAYFKFILMNQLMWHRDPS